MWILRLACRTDQEWMCDIFMMVSGECSDCSDCGLKFLTKIIIEFPAFYARHASVPKWPLPLAKSSNICASSMLLKTGGLCPECSQHSLITLFVAGHHSKISSTLILSNIQTTPVTSLLDGLSIWYAAAMFMVSCLTIGNIEVAWIEVVQCCQVIDRPGMPRAVWANSATHAPPSR